MARDWRDYDDRDAHQDRLAERASLTRNKISAIERNANLLKLYEISRIARSVGVDLLHFMNGAP